MIALGGSPDPVVQTLKDEHFVGVELGLDHNDITRGIKPDQVDEASAKRFVAASGSPGWGFSQQGVFEQQEAGVSTENNLQVVFLEPSVLLGFGPFDTSLDFAWISSNS